MLKTPPLNCGYTFFFLFVLLSYKTLIHKKVKYTVTDTKSLFNKFCNQIRQIQASQSKISNVDFLLKSLTEGWTGILPVDSLLMCFPINSWKLVSDKSMDSSFAATIHQTFQASFDYSFSWISSPRLLIWLTISETRKKSCWMLSLTFINKLSKSLFNDCRLMVITPFLKFPMHILIELHL